MASFTSLSPQETERLGDELGRVAEPGWVFGLSGPLGAGKTQLVKGIARGLGIQTRVLSPTFALVHEHRSGRLPLFHLDLYRLKNSGQIIAAGLDEYLSPQHGVTVVEWYERWDGPPPPLLCRVTLEAATEYERLISYDLPGA